MTNRSTYIRLYDNRLERDMDEKLDLSYYPSASSITTNLISYHGQYFSRFHNMDYLYSNGRGDHPSNTIIPYPHYAITFDQQGKIRFGDIITFLGTTFYVHRSLETAVDAIENHHHNYIGICVIPEYFFRKRYVSDLLGVPVMDYQTDLLNYAVIMIDSEYDENYDCAGFNIAGLNYSNFGISSAGEYFERDGFSVYVDYANSINYAVCNCSQYSLDGSSSHVSSEPKRFPYSPYPHYILFNNSNDTNRTNLSEFPLVNKANSSKIEDHVVRTTKSVAILPSDNFENGVDASEFDSGYGNNMKYFFNTGIFANYIPSPYKSNGMVNPLFFRSWTYQVNNELIPEGIDPVTEIKFRDKYPNGFNVGWLPIYFRNPMKEFDGYISTGNMFSALYNLLKGFEQDLELIENSIFYRVANDFSIAGKNFYIPSLAEMSCIMVRMKAINMRIAELNSLMNSSISTISEDMYWTSTQASNMGQYAIWTTNGSVWNLYKNQHHKAKVVFKLSSKDENVKIISKDGTELDTSNLGTFTNYRTHIKP